MIGPTRLPLLLLLLLTTTGSLGAAGDNTDDVTTTSYNRATESSDDVTAVSDTWNDVAVVRPPDDVRAAVTAELNPSAVWGRLAPAGRPRRPRRSAQQDPAAPRNRRRKGRRRGRKRGRKGRRGRTTTTAAPAQTTTTTAAPTTTVPPPPPPPPSLPPEISRWSGHSGGRRLHGGAPRVTAPTTTSPPVGLDPPVQDYNVAPAGVVNYRPVIGVLSQAPPSRLNRLVPDEEFSSYISASYVRFLEGAGARVVPIMVDQSHHYYREMYRYLNGLLLPGGEADLEHSGYIRAVKAVWKVAAQHPNDHFPVMGISLGMEMIAHVEGQQSFIDCSAINMAAPLQFEPDAGRSRLFGGVGGDLRRVMAADNVTVSFHKRCLTPRALRAGAMSRDFRPLASGRDWHGRQFVAAVEHKRLPIYGLQFHPEKPMFEWGRSDDVSNIPHTAEAILTSQHIANHFVEEARKNRHRFPSPDLEEDYLIYNYEPEFTGIMGAEFTSCYFFY